MEENKKLLKKTALVFLIYSVVIGIVSYIILTNKELSYTIGSSMFKLISLEVPSYADVYVSILIYSVLLTLPSGLLLYVSLYERGHFMGKYLKVVKFLCNSAYMILTIGGIYLFYNYGGDLFATIPVIKPEDVKSDIFKELIAFFDNLSGIYLWYIFPVLLPIVSLVSEFISFHYICKDDKKILNCLIVESVVKVVLYIVLVVGLFYLSILLGVVSLLALLLFIFLGACIAAKSGAPRYKGTIYANGQSADIYIK